MRAARTLLTYLLPRPKKRIALTLGGAMASLDKLDEFLRAA